VGTILSRARKQAVFGLFSADLMEILRLPGYTGEAFFQQAAEIIEVEAWARTFHWIGRRQPQIIDNLLTPPACQGGAGHRLLWPAS
jgi:hypothetical protein